MFKTFPEFSKLTLADREEYERFIKDFPPVADLTFVSLMTVWNALGGARVARLNGNLVISYWLPGADDRSGLSLVGTNKIDESLCIIFDHLRNSEQNVKLIHVPQSVVDHIRYPEIFNFKAKASDEEYIISFKKHASLPDTPFYRRGRIKHFVRSSGNLEMRSLDLTLSKNQKLLLDHAALWPKKGLNNIGQIETEAMHVCIKYAAELNVQNICLFDDGELAIFNLYTVFPQKNYILVAHARLNYTIPHIFEYMTYRFSQWWLSEGIEFANIHNDLSLPRLRVLKVALRPVELLRKYTIRPLE